MREHDAEKVHTAKIFTCLDTSIASNSAKKSNFDPPSIPRDDDIKKKLKNP